MDDFVFDVGDVGEECCKFGVFDFVCCFGVECFVVVGNFDEVV